MRVSMNNAKVPHAYHSLFDVADQGAIDKVKVDHSKFNPCLDLIRHLIRAVSFMSSQSVLFRPF
jgi:hypothetical protein